jgi:hypothetical protein
VVERDVGGPLVEHGAVGVDDDQADLQDAVAFRVQAGGLEVDDGEPGQAGASRHTAHPRARV